MVAVEAQAAGELELELSYVVLGAGWSSAYDARVAADRGTAGRLDLTWFGMVVQATGEDWPECDLTLSTARPAVASTVPELEPWWIDVPRPAPVVAYAAMPRDLARQAAPADGPAEVAVEPVLAEAVNGVVAASWRLARPTAVPGDGTPHRTTITAFALPARLDHVTAPALSPEAHLRATVTNDSGQVLLAGPVSTFSDDAFVGTSALSLTAPGADIELALGVDDRVVVERELVERTAHKARFGSARGAVERWTITVQNRCPAAARVIVRDRLPVSRHAGHRGGRRGAVAGAGRARRPGSVGVGGHHRAGPQVGGQHPVRRRAPEGGAGHRVAVALTDPAHVLGAQLVDAGHRGQAAGSG